MRTQTIARSRAAISFRIVVNFLFVAAIYPTSTAWGLEPCNQPGATQPCNYHGQPGERDCNGQVWTPCNPVSPTSPPPVIGTITPKYYVLTVIYAPPGTNGGRSSSSVAYGSGSTEGSTVSSSNSFKQASGLSVTASGGITGVGQAEVGVSVGYTNNATNSQSVDIKMTGTSEIADAGPGADGINHDHDLIYLWLKPTLQITLVKDGSGKVTSVSWKPVNGGQTVLTYLYVGWLKNPSSMPAGEAQLLQRYAVNAQDFPQILKADPYANGSRFSPVFGAILGSTPDPRRYQSLFTTFPYEPPFGAGDPVPTLKFTSSYTNTASTTSATTNEYTVGLTVSATASFADSFKTTLKASQNWTWTSGDTRSSSVGTSSTATVTVGGPSFGYTGATEMAVYYDVLYRTFLIVPLPSTSPGLTGAIANHKGSPLGGKEVIVFANGIKYRTFTNAKGQYRVFGKLSGPIEVRVGTISKKIPQIPPDRKADLVVSK